MIPSKRFISTLFLSSFLVSLLLTAQQPLEKISVKGNKFVTESGETMVFDGVNIRDPHGLEQDGKWTKAHFEEAKNWGADLIRLPVHPLAWRERGEKEYIKLLDEAVQWAKELEMYLIIDWHSIGNLSEEKFQAKGYITTVKETHHFWNVISKHYSGEPVIAMYELFNEPTISGEAFGTMTWTTWKKINEEMIQLIRKNDEKTIILVAGFDWAYDLRPIKKDPIEMENIAYVSHPYPEKRKQPWEEQWEKDWGFVAKKYPVILTEIGYALPTEKGVHIPVHGDETYGNALVDFCSERGISFVVWCFDASWSPLMYTGDYVPTSQGKFFKEVMQKN
ncbi:MAG: cellulase family glycosylhydrolase [Bacteroidales bacterium]|jgi:endoglucanase|nr:cellulase family glycosylhydrolase [Bacteroidales bacterium]